MFANSNLYEFMKFIKAYFLLTVFIALSLVLSCNIEPYESGNEEETNKPKTCEEAIQSVVEAAANFSLATESNYADICKEYKISLKNQIAICGDEQGVLQAVIDGLGDCTVNIGGGNSFGDHAFMTANINKIQYDDLKPSTYLFGQGIGFNGFFSRSDDDYIELQGNSTYSTPTVIEAETKEINIHIPSVYWKEGTFVMYHIDTDVSEPEIFYSFLEFDISSNIDKENIDGEIVIDEFNTVERVIKGTFKFDYKLTNTEDGSTDGPFKVTGTFDYPLDDDHFD